MVSGKKQCHTQTYVNSSPPLTRMSESEMMPEESGAPYLAFGALGSVLLALYEYYLRDNHQRGMFIGLWSPTMIGFAIYLNQEKSE
jgi:hypothetical protein